MACPVCDKTSAPDFLPFCSKRCADVDLNRWFSGNYAIAAEEMPDEEDMEALITAIEPGKTTS